MSLRESKGNMYPWVTHTWNPISGLCRHACLYCYMRRYPLRPVRLKAEDLREDLGSGRVIFVGSGTDMFAFNIPNAWIKAVLLHCRFYPGNQYLFQSKNPWKFTFFNGLYPANTIFGTTLESDIGYQDLSQAPLPAARVEAMGSLKWLRRMVSIEPVLRFNPKKFINMIKAIKPEFVSIGADSQGHKLPEPTPRELEALIGALRGFTEIKLKKNLGRILGREIKDRG